MAVEPTAADPAAAPAAPVRDHWPPLAAAALAATGGPVSAVRLFVTFAFVYFFSALLRAVTATLAPVFSAELMLGAADLGLLAGAFFLGFAVMQLPLGVALDRFGPRRCLATLLGAAVVGCLAFARADGLAGLCAARLLIGAGLAACLMAPLTAFRRWLNPAAQLRANSWMLMTGSLGMLASTLPVQWLLPTIGWRGLFVGVAALLAVGLLLVLCLVPGDDRMPTEEPAPGGVGAADGYRAIVAHPLFVTMAPLAFFLYGSLIAVQSLWAGPWLMRVGGASSDAAAHGLFAINLSMLVAFLGWGTLMPALVRRGIGAVRVVAWVVPMSLLLLAANVAAGAAAGAWHWAAWCVACSGVSLTQPAIGAAFPAAQVGRALSAFNLVIFAGVFCLQWGLGLAVDALIAGGASTIDAFRWAFGGLGACCAAAWLWFLAHRPRGHG